MLVGWFDIVVLCQSPTLSYRRPFLESVDDSLCNPYLCASDGLSPPFFPLIIIIITIITIFLLAQVLLFPFWGDPAICRVQGVVLGRSVCRGVWKELKFPAQLLICETIYSINTVKRRKDELVTQKEK